MEDLSQLLLPRLSVCVKELLQAPTEGGWGHPSLWRVWARAKLALSTPPCPPQQTTDHHSWIGVHTAGGWMWRVEVPQDHPLQHLQVIGSGHWSQVVGTRWGARFGDWNHT